MAVAKLRKLGIAKATKRASIYHDLALIGTHKCANNLQQGALASATSANNRDYLATLDIERKAMKHLQIAKALDNVLNVYHPTLF
jgi:hypothetical protein